MGDSEQERKVSYLSANVGFNGKRGIPRRFLRGRGKDRSKSEAR